MKAKNVTFTLLAMIALYAGVVSAGTVTMVHPATSDRFEVSAIGGLIILNASQDFNATWCAFYGSSASTANSSSTIVLANVTHNYDFTNNSVNSSINSRLFEDSNDYTFSATCANITSATTYTSASSTGVILDNTVPDVPTVSTLNGYTSDDGNLDFNASVTGNQTTTCTLRFFGTIPTGAGASVTITETSGTSLCRKTYSSASNGVYRFSMTASDGTNTSAESAAIDIIETLDGNRKKSLVLSQEQAAAVTGQQKQGLSKGAILVIIGAAVYVAYQYGGKKR